MAVMAKWGGKVWEVSNQRIAALDGISASVELDTGNSDSKSGSSTKTKSLKLQTLNFDFDLAYVTGCDVRSEYESWAALIGQCAPFYLAGQRFGPQNLQLTSVSLSDTILNDIGQILKGRISITLTEYASGSSSQKTVSTSKSSAATAKKPTGKSSGGVGRRLSAVSVGASSTDKVAKKTGNVLLDAAIKAASDVVSIVTGK